MGRGRFVHRDEESRGRRIDQEEEFADTKKRRGHLHVIVLHIAIRIR